MPGNSIGEKAAALAAWKLALVEMLMNRFPLTAVRLKLAAPSAVTLFKQLLGWK